MQTPQTFLDTPNSAAHYAFIHSDEWKRIMKTIREDFRNKARLNLPSCFIEPEPRMNLIEEYYAMQQ